MAYSGVKIETWNRSTPRDGLLLDSEFSQLYDDIETYISGNSGSAPPYTLKQLADGTVTFAGAKTFSSKITGSISGNCDGSSGSCTGNSATADGIKETGTGAGTMREKIIEIGSWNMNWSASGDATKDVAHGLTDTKIRKVSVVIIRDGSALRHDFASGLGIINYDTTNIKLNQRTGGDFDNNNYDSTTLPANRGWITIEYID
jgi:hypothetical protein